MVKSWHIFVFSLVPLALVLAGVIVGSIHFEGGDSVKEDLTPVEPASIIVEAPVFPASHHIVYS